MMNVIDMWNSLTRIIQRAMPDFLRGPYITSATHALITFLGLVPLPIGPLGIALFYFTGIPWMWLAASASALVWYWRREYRQTGLKPKPRYRNGEKLTFGQRWDTWIDAIFPTVAFILQLLWLL